MATKKTKDAAAQNGAEAGEMIMDESTVLNTQERPYIIKDAAIKDGFCNYSFEITGGVGTNDTHNVKGSSMVMDDMFKAFNKLNVHLAVIDDVYKHSNIEIEDIDKYHGEELTSLYHVTGIKIKGDLENESVTLIGNKFVSSAGGRIDLVTPRIPMDNLSSYKWYNELKAAVDTVRNEVALYKEGKYVIPEEEIVEKDNPKQLTIGDAISETTAGANSANWDEDMDDEFEKAKQ